MLYRLTQRGVGEDVAVEYLREGKLREARVPLILPPESPPRDMRRIEGRSPLAGLVVSNVNPAVIVETGLPLDASGVVVSDVAGPAQRMGFRPGDVLVEINGRPMTSTRDVDQAARLGGRSWSVVLTRDGRQQLLRFRV